MYLQEDTWRPVNFMNLETTERFEEEMMDFGLINIHNYTYGKFFPCVKACSKSNKIFEHRIYEILCTLP